MFRWNSHDVISNLNNKVLSDRNCRLALVGVSYTLIVRGCLAQLDRLEGILHHRREICKGFIGFLVKKSKLGLIMGGGVDVFTTF